MMPIKYSIKSAAKAIVTNKSRSFLTILGIVIGIAAIILIMSIGRGTAKLILGELSGMGAETIVIRPGREPKGPSDIPQTIFADSLKSRDVDALRKKSNVPTLADIAPAVIVPGSVSYGNETYKPTIFGWSADFMRDAFNINPVEGRFFDESEIKNRADVVIIGAKVKRELFGNADAVGENIKIKNKKFRVIGILPSRGQISFLNLDDMVIVPYTTAQLYLLGITHFHEIVVKATDPTVVERTVRDIQLTLRESHGITDPAKDDFFVVTQEGLVKQIGNIMSGLTLFLSLVVAIALVVGGIGVMNIMLVSVTERTREIGLRKALGATEKDIMLQFLLEATMLTLIGGAVGIMLGAIGAFIFPIVLSFATGLDWSFSFPVVAAVLGLGVSASVGFIFGIYPAYQASKKSPMEALRYE
ncbi:MAG: ABC transporter permease [Candidatus Niyogibacteria bacterium]|nr:ABC transporter permease [Candidatus Niyogibacteria bacterium]